MAVDTEKPSSGEVILAIEGMTCASCVRRVERSLTRVAGVQEATVNLATEKAKVVFDPSVVTVEQLGHAVEKAGYRVGEVTPPELPVVPTDSDGTVPAPTTVDLHEQARQREADDLKRKSLISLAIGVVMMAAMYLPLHLDLALVAPLLLIAATVVQVWAGGVFYRTAWAAARHGGTNMSTLVALGSSAAYGYSAFVTLWPGLAQRWGFPIHLYF